MNKDLPFAKHSKMLIDMGRHRDALLICDKWVEVQPANPQAWYVTAFCQSQLLLRLKALDSVRKANELESNNPHITILYAKTLIDTGSTTEGLNLCLQLLEQKNQDPFVLDRIAIALAQANQYSDALSAAQKAITGAPNQSRFYITLATILTFTNKEQDAENAYQKALKLDPNNTEIYNSLARLRTATADKNYIELLLKALEKHHGQLLPSIMINYALEKQYEDLGEYDLAFKHLEDGANFASQHTPYDEEHVLSQLQGMQHAYPKEIFENNDGHDCEEPIFIVGMPRSGTTLVEQIITTDDNVYAAGELQHFHTLLQQQLQAHKNAHDNPSLAVSAKHIDYQSLGAAYIDCTRPQTGHTRHFIDKFPLNFSAVGPIALALPQAKFINLSRNPIDTCFSNYKLLFQPGTAMYSYNQEDLARYYAQYKKIMAHWQECLPDRVLNVCYEDLTEKPEQESKRIFEFLGLQWSAECLEFHKSDSAVATASSRQVRNPINKSSVAKWKKFEKHLQPLIDELNKQGVSC